MLKKTCATLYRCGDIVLLYLYSDTFATIAMGCTDPWHLEDLSNGVLIEEMASKNRKVIILDAESEEAKLVENWCSKQIER